MCVNNYKEHIGTIQTRIVVVSHVDDPFLWEGMVSWALGVLSSTKSEDDPFFFFADLLEGMGAAVTGGLSGVLSEEWLTEFRSTPIP
jgi:hypothetical protein